VEGPRTFARLTSLALASIEKDLEEALQQEG
jgi:hypothetical protein